MRILAWNHFFDQDLDALQAGLGSDDVLIRLPYQRLYWTARRHFPKSAFVGVENASRDTIAVGLRRYERAVGALATWLCQAYDPTVFVVPTDAIFYLRPLISAIGRLGVPAVVVQKETSISPMVLSDHSAAVRENVPFMCEAMTVCSDLHKEFWVRAGTDPERVIVTGQPRFDVYNRYKARTTNDRPILLYLSYDDVAYLPSDTGVAFEGDWRDLRRETEIAIAGAATSWDVVVKEHPQQRVGAVTWLPPGAQRAARSADTRQLILEADAVVAFQTTAAFEAAATGKPVLYPAWGPVFEMSREQLLPLDRLPGVAHHVASPAELARLLALAPSDLPRPDPGHRAEILAQLGPLDGGATARVVDVLRGHEGRAEPGPVRRWQLARARAVRFGAPMLRAVGSLLGRRGRALTGRARDWTMEGREGMAVRANS